MTAFTVPPFTVPVMVALPLLPVMVSLSPSREMRSELLLSTAHLTVPLAP